MLTGNWMCRPPITVSQDASIQEAVALFEKHNIPMPPLIRDAPHAGVITDLDIKRAAASQVLHLENPEPAKSISRINVRPPMDKQPIAPAADRTVEEAAALFCVRNIE